jgi:hypothetical protein
MPYPFTIPENVPDAVKGHAVLDPHLIHVVKKVMIAGHEDNPAKR